LILKHRKRANICTRRCSYRAAIGLARNAFAAAGVHRAVGNILVYHPDRGLNESTAAADLGNDAISMVPMVCLDCFTRPAIRRSLQRLESMELPIRQKGLREIGRNAHQSFPQRKFCVCMERH
jgi:hypothetical protein